MIVKYKNKTFVPVGPTVRQSTLADPENQKWVLGTLPGPQQSLGSQKRQNSPLGPTAWALEPAGTQAQCKDPTRVREIKIN